MNIPINNYRKYIAGKLFAICGFLVAFILLFVELDFRLNPYDKSIIYIERAMTSYLATLIILYAPPVCMALSLLEFFIRKYFNFPIKVKPFKELNKLGKFLTTIFWTSIIFILIRFFMILRIIIIEHFLY